MNRILKLGAVVALSAAASSTVWGAIADFHSVDFVYSQNPQLFKDLFASAQTQTVRIAILGDSQETSPTSHGYQYFPRLNYEMWKRYGNSPETPMEGCFYFASGQTPPGDWLTMGACTTPGPTATRITASRILPNVVPKAISTLNGSTNISGGTHGQLTFLAHNAASVSTDAQIPTSNDYFNKSGTVKARIFAATNASSGEVAWQTRPTDNLFPSYSPAVGQTGTLTPLGLQSGTFDVKAGDTAALTFNGRKYLQLEVFGTSDSTYTDIVGLRFFNQTYPQGVVFDTFSAGGYTAQTFLQNHSNAGAMFKAQAFTAALIHYGANEAGGVTAAQFQTDITSLISQVRAWAGVASLPVILIADVYETPSPALTTSEQAEYDKYVGAQLAIAQTDANVMVINARRLMEDIGWSASGQPSQYLTDGIHYTANGAIVLAAAEVAAMMNEVNVTGCLNDAASLHFSSGTKLNVTLGGTTPCSGYGRLTMSGTLTLDQPTLNVTLGNSFVPAVGQQFKILSFTSASGTFAAVNLPTLSAGLHWNTSALYTTGTIAVANQSSPAPTVSITSGGSQTVTLPDTPTAISFTLTGTQPLSVHASSSNTAIFPSANIMISSGCGTSTLTCTATLSPASGQSGMATITVSATDSTSQVGQADASITINAAAPPPPPPPPGAPTVTVTSGGSQSITLPSPPAPVAFTLTGTGALTVAATSSNTTLLPNSGIAISAGCGSSTASCTATLTPASNQTGSTTITFTVTDSVPQSSTANATLTVSSSSTGGGNNGGGSSGGGGGGGAMDLVTLIALSAGLVVQRRRSALPQR